MVLKMCIFDRAANFMKMKMRIQSVDVVSTHNAQAHRSHCANQA
jgi:hypothetical protein